MFLPDSLPAGKAVRPYPGLASIPSRELPEGFRESREVTKKPVMPTPALAGLSWRSRHRYPKDRHNRTLRSKICLSCKPAAGQAPRPTTRHSCHGTDRWTTCKGTTKKVTAQPSHATPRLPGTGYEDACNSEDNPDTVAGTFPRRPSGYRYLCLSTEIP